MKSPLYSIFIVAFSANLPVPLFPIYINHYNFNEFDLTLLFSLYGVFLFTSLLFSSSLIDKLGDELVVLISFGLSFIGSLFFICSTSGTMLFFARCLTGASVGMFMGAGNSLLIKRAGAQTSRAAFLSSMLTMFGFGAGPLFSGLLAQYVPQDAERTPYQLLLIGLVCALVLHIYGTARIDFQPSNCPIRLRIRFGVPAANIKEFFFFVGPSIFLTFSLNGTIISLLPSFVRDAIHSTNLAWSGVLLFILLGGGAVSQHLRWLKKKTQRVRYGVLILPVGAWLVLLAGKLQSISLLFFGIAIQSVGNGWAFQGSLQLASAMAKGVDSASVFSTYYVSAYLGMVFSPVLIGALTQYIGLFESLIFLVVIETVLAITLVISSIRLNVSE